MEKETLFEKIGYYWGMSNRKFSSMSEKELQQYETLANEVLDFEACIININNMDRHENRAEVCQLLCGNNHYQNAC